jgi:23S rRNA pseudouridine1911/1915/1917 synthase
VPKREFEITPESGANERLDVYLSRQIQDYTRSQCQRFIDKGQVAVNGEAKKSSYKLREGDRIEIEVEMPEAAEILPEDIPLKILFGDEDILVIDKPAGMIVHPGAGARKGTLVNALIYHFPDIRGLGDIDRPGIVHRLDKETSGVMVVARSLKAYDELRRQFKAREIKKIYLALVWGRLPKAEGRFDWPIGRHIKHGQRMSIKTRKPRSAVTEYRVQKEYKVFSLLEIRPVTGRTHQIRVHLSAAGHPLAGDRRYGSIPKSKYKFSRLFLHAHVLSFCHPVTGLRHDFTSPLPEELKGIMDSLDLA